MDRKIRHIAFNIFLLFVFSRLVIFVGYLIYCHICGNNPGFVDGLNQWDSGWYLKIVKNGYTVMPDPREWNEFGQASWAFFPLYPMIVRVFYVICGGMISEHTTGVILSNIFIYLAACVSYFYIRETRGKESYTVPALLFFAPFTLYFSCMYTEALFVLLIVLCLYFSHQKRFLPAGITCALVSATRVPGVFLVFVIFFEMYSQLYSSFSFRNLCNFIKHLFVNPDKIFILMLCPLGIFMYMLFLHFRVGDAWAFAHVQFAWHRENGNPVMTVIEGLRSARRIKFLAFCTCGGILLGIWMFYKRHFMESFFLLIVIILPVCSSLQSMHRFIMGSFVAECGIADILDSNRILKYSAFIISAAAELVLIILWFQSSHLVI